MNYARLQTVSVLQDPEEAETAEGKLLEIVSAHPGFAGLCLMEAVEDTAAGAVLTLWRSVEDARLASSRTSEARSSPRPVTVHSDRVYEVEGWFEGPAAGDRPGAVMLIYFDGPHDDDWLASSRFAHERRIVPIMREVPGVVKGFALWDPENRDAVVVTLAVSLEAIARAGMAINSTELLPDENPALLTGPDRAVVHLVSGFVPAPV